MINGKQGKFFPLLCSFPKRMNNAITIGVILNKQLQRFFCLAVAFLFTFTSHAQLEFANWVWIDSNLVTWNTGLPTDSSGPVIPYNGGSGYDAASISDRQGNLILSAISYNIFNGSGQLIVNNSSHPFNASASPWNVLLCPVPCSDSLFYVFYCMTFPFGTDTLQWSYVVVDVSAASGQGQLISGPILLDSNVSQAGDICRHGNNKDFWLVTRSLDGSTFHSWQITDTGIANTPIISSYGTLGSTYYGTEYLDISPNGKWVALSTRKDPTTVANTPQNLFSFDDQNGSVTHFCYLDDSSLIRPEFNLHPCFSPDNSKLYIVSLWRGLWQFDLSSGNPATISNSGVNIASYSADQPFGLFDLQIANDGKIYVSRYGKTNSLQTFTTYMAVINNPNDTASACNYVLNGLQCNQYTWFGLPNVIHNLYVKRNIQHDSLECTGDTTTFTFDNYAYFDSAQWYIDTGSTQFIITSDSLVQHVFDSAGVYPIMAVTYSGCRLDTFYDTVTVLLTPAPDLGPDTILCEGDTIAISNDWQYTYLWSTGDTTEGIQILVPDTYWLELSNYCGIERDTVIVDSIIEALVVFPAEDTLLCDGDTLWLDATVDLGTYLWHVGSAGSVFAATSPALVWVEAQNACGISSDTINVRFTTVPVIPPLDTALCLGDTLFIDLTTNSLSTFLWYNGDTAAFDTITTQNNYWVQETNLCGSDADSFFVAFVTDPQTYIGPDTVMCSEDFIVLDANTPFGSYVWSTGGTSDTLSVSSPLLMADTNYFSVTVTNACLTDTDTIFIMADHPLTPQIGPDTVACTGATVTLESGPFLRTVYQWSNGPTTNGQQLTAGMAPLYENAETAIWVRCTNTCGVFSDTVFIAVDVPLQPDLGPDVAVCFGETVLLDAGAFPRAVYVWNDSIPGQTRNLQAGSTELPVHLTSGLYVLVSNQCGSYSDTVLVKVDSLPADYFTETLRFCEGDTLLLGIAKPDMDYLQWQDGSNDTARLIYEQASLMVTYYNHCGETNDLLPVTRQPLPEVVIQSPQRLCEDELELVPVIANQGDQSYSYKWDDDSEFYSRFISEVGFYSLTVVDEYGCSDSLVVEVQPCGADFYTANSFSPDQNLLNEYWKPEGEGLEHYVMRIYDRWGQLVFEFNESSPGWDGTRAGSPAPLGVYFWQMQAATGAATKQQAFSGSVNLIR